MGVYRLVSSVEWLSSTRAVWRPSADALRVTVTTAAPRSRHRDAARICSVCAPVWETKTNTSRGSAMAALCRMVGPSVATAQGIPRRKNFWRASRAT